MKRIFDVCISSVGLTVLWPVILLCILVSRLELGENGLFRQERVGQHGKHFWIYKVKTMKSTAVASDSITVAGDSRIYRFGRLFRALKFDEFPQLWNVLRGDMSLVGPRPDVPGYADELPINFSEILLLKPGITGPASIKYRNEEELLGSCRNPEYVNDTVIYPDKVLINLDYGSNWSLRTDIRYLMMTVGLMKIPKELVVDELVDFCKS